MALRFTIAMFRKYIFEIEIYYKFSNSNDFRVPTSTRQIK